MKPSTSLRVLIAAAVAWTPTAPAAAAFSAAPVAPAAGVGSSIRVAPVPFGSVSVGLNQPLLSVPGSLSVLPNLAPAPSARSVAAAPSALAAPSAVAAAALPAAQAAAALPVSVLPSAEAAAPAKRNGAEDAREAGTPSAGSDLGALSKEVASSIQAAGPVADASPAKAASLGDRLLELITRPFRRRSAPEPTAPSNKTLRRIALNAASDEAGPAVPAASPEVTRAAMQQTLQFVSSVFNAHYAPLDWKGSRFGIHLNEQYEKARKAVAETPNITTRDFQDILAAFVGSLKDYHVSIQFYSTEASKLPFSIMGAEGKYYLAYVDREALPEENFPFKVGDEITAFDGRPVADAVADLLRVKSEGGSEATDRALAERRLTRRIRQGGDLSPEGPVSITVKGADGTVRTARMQWQHIPELVPSAPVRDGGGLFEPPAPQAGPVTTSQAGDDAVDSNMAASLRAAILKLIPSGLNPGAALLSRKGPRDSANPFQIGERESFVPALGEVLWRSNARGAFNAYIYKDAAGRKVGYVRIGSFEGEAKEAAAFGQLMKKFEAETDALVIDQVNNPGGSLFYMYALLSRLTAKPLTAPKQRVAIGEEDAYEALQTLMAAQQVTTEELAQQILGPSIGGYRTTLKLWKQMVAYASFIYSELRAGRRLTELFPFLGVDKIEPHPTERYTKPIMLLINELDFSCGDFFPAILQDNKRVTIFGTRTSGAGGAVKAVQFPNQFGIAGLSYTWTIAMRTSGQPIENLGVTPDVSYQLAAEDFKNGFAGYVRAVNEAMARLLGPSGGAVTAQRARRR